MYCPSCNAEVAESAAFCPQCGSRLDNPSAAAAPPTPVQRLREAQAASAANEEPERELWRGSYSPKAMVGSWLLAGMVTLAALVAIAVSGLNPAVAIPAAAGIVVLWLALMGYLLIQRLSVDYRLTTQRFIHESGLLRRSSNRIEVIDIDDVTFVQGIIERIVGVGTIKILSSDTSHPALVLHGIDEVGRVATLIDNARRDERRKRGLYVEAV